MNTQHRTQLYLDNFHFAALKQRARKDKKSVAAIVREAIDLMFAKQEEANKKEKDKDWEKFFKLAGIGASGFRDGAENHDKYIASDEIKSWRKK